MPDDEESLSASALAALDLLPPAERRGLEAQCAADPRLAAEQRALADTAAALALAAPPRRAPAHVWDGIARAVAAERRRIIPFPRSWREAARGGWAVAAGLAFGWAGHAWWVSWPAPAPGVAPGAGPTAAHVQPAGVADGARPPATDGAGPAVRPPAAGNRTAAVPVAETPAAREARQLREQVRTLAGQVADLTQQMTQATALPPGTRAFHLLQLRGTNAPGQPLRLAPVPHAAQPAEHAAAAPVPEWQASETASLAERFARAAAENTPAAGPVETTAPDPAPAAAAVNDPASPAATDAAAAASAWVAVSPGTGEGTAVVEFEAAPPAGTQVDVVLVHPDGQPGHLLASTTTDGATLLVGFLTPPEASLAGRNAGSFEVVITPPADSLLPVPAAPGGGATNPPPRRP